MATTNKLTPTRRALLEQIAKGTVRISHVWSCKEWYLGTERGTAYARPSTQKWVTERKLAEQLPGGAIVLTEAGKAALAGD